MEKVKYETHISPSGKAVYPWLNIPDTKFDADGVFSVKLRMDKKGAAKINSVIKPLMNGGTNNPVKPEVDDQGEKTGNYLVNFKMKAHVKTKSGDEWDQKPVLLDGDGNRSEAKIGGGSNLQVAYEAIPYTGMGGGVSLRMKKVRILDLVEYQAGESGKDTSNWGEEKGSYTSSSSAESEKDWNADEMVEEEDEDF